MNNDDILAAQKELLSSSFSQAQAYTNVILAAGYAGFFAIWSQMGPHLTSATKFWSGLLISLSVAGFVGWEIYGMIVRSKSMLGIARAVNNPEQYVALIEEHRQSQHHRAIQVSRMWHMALPFIAGTAFTALAIMLSAFVHGLWVTYSSA